MADGVFPGEIAENGGGTPLLDRAKDWNGDVSELEAIIQDGWKILQDSEGAIEDENDDDYTITDSFRDLDKAARILLERRLDLTLRLRCVEMIIWVAPTEEEARAYTELGIHELGNIETWSQLELDLEGRLRAWSKHFDSLGKDDSPETPNIIRQANTTSASPPSPSLSPTLPPSKSLRGTLQAPSGSAPATTTAGLAPAPLVHRSLSWAQVVSPYGAPVPTAPPPTTVPVVQNNGGDGPQDVYGTQNTQDTGNRSVQGRDRGGRGDGRGRGHGRGGRGYGDIVRGGGGRGRGNVIVAPVTPATPAPARTPGGVQGGAQARQGGSQGGRPLGSRNVPLGTPATVERSQLTHKSKEA